MLLLPATTTGSKFKFSQCNFVVNTVVKLFYSNGKCSLQLTYCFIIHSEWQYQFHDKTMNPELYAADSQFYDRDNGGT